MDVKRKVHYNLASFGLEAEPTSFQFWENFGQPNIQKLHNFYTPASAIRNPHRTLLSPAPHPPARRRMCHFYNAGLPPQVWSNSTSGIGSAPKPAGSIKRTQLQ